MIGSSCVQRGHHSETRQRYMRDDKIMRRSYANEEARTNVLACNSNQLGALIGFAKALLRGTKTEKQHCCKRRRKSSSRFLNEAMQILMDREKFITKLGIITKNNNEWVKYSDNKDTVDHQRNNSCQIKKLNSKSVEVEQHEY
ncbi:hypothetical protein DICVIV_04291 [Dictyocaulus viviparus]|uniref:Uncharacterized protein n=1 Tax=Dictyocaulus viviparus TaxID=29172 RepID=A0A0D8XYI7_DICVI|nr:hypothetical protein DICVIV_04291 [Dictyocaulus viviparus]